MPGHVVRQRKTQKAEENAWVERIRADGDFLIGHGLVRASKDAEQRAKAAIGQRAVWVQGDGAFKCGKGLVGCEQPPARNLHSLLGILSHHQTEAI